MYQKATLDNGLRLVTANMPHTRAVSIGFFIGAGSRYEDDARAGISHFIEHLCFKGTPTHPTAAAISTVIEGVGGMVNAGTDRELTVYWCKIAEPHFATSVDVMVDMLLNSLFEPAEVEKERQVIIEEINMSLDSPIQRAVMLIDDLLWPGHPLGRDIAGSKESVAGIKREMILDYVAGYYQPCNAVLSVAGDIRHEEILETVTGVTTVWKNSKPPAGFLPYRKKNGRQVSIEKRDTEQTQMILALPGLSITHPDRFKLDLLNVILGEGMSSRLFTEIRDNLGLAYSIQSYTEHLLDTGATAISAGVDTKNLPVAIKAVLHELHRLREPVPESELIKAKEFSKGRILLRLEDSRSVSGWIGGQEILTDDILTVDQVLSIIDSITAEELRQLAEEMLVAEDLRLAVVGPVDPDEPLEDLLKL
ncbi:MAG TPA: insulinase family protein [Dehalococcoidia bacterium]|nr:insulinase family protein [Dehalococcoidia bacterium]